MIYRDVSWLVIPAKAGIQRLSASPKTLVVSAGWDEA
jgi:hypothetical protein